ncbi:hypothetical protein Tco_1423504 [Tanacetum coccineum]
MTAAGSGGDEMGDEGGGVVVTRVGNGDGGDGVDNDGGVVAAGGVRMEWRWYCCGDDEMMVVVVVLVAVVMVGRGDGSLGGGKEGGVESGVRRLLEGEADDGCW